MTISMLKIRRPLGRLIFNMGIAIPGKTVFLIETAPRKCPRYQVADEFEIYTHEITSPFPEAHTSIAIFSAL